MCVRHLKVYKSGITWNVIARFYLRQQQNKKLNDLLKVD